MLASVGVNERQVLSLRRGHVDAAERRPKHVRARIRLSGEPAFNSRESETQQFHVPGVLRRVGGQLKGIQKVGERTFIEIETQQGSVRTRSGEQVREPHAGISVGQWPPVCAPLHKLTLEDLVADDVVFQIGIAPSSRV
jgi:hypothetical protein